MNVYPSVGYLKTLSERLQVYVPTLVSPEIKPKRELQIKKEYGELYKAQLATVSVIRDIEVSHLLGMNDVVVPHLVEEYAKLNFALKTLSNRLKSMKQFDGDLNGEVSTFITSLSVKEIGSRLYSDLKYLSGWYKMDLDLKYWMEEFKKFEPSDDFARTILGSS